MLGTNFFTRHKLDNREKAQELLEFLIDFGGVFSPVRFDLAEPVRRPLDPSDLTEAVNLLSGYPEHRWGEIFLKGKRHKSLLWLSWSEDLEVWYFSVAGSCFKKHAASREFCHFIKQFVTKFSVVFGNSASEDDWDAKHWLVIEREGGGRSKEKVGTSLEGCLPGVYWLNIFGPELTEFFGREKLLNLPAEQHLDLGDSGVGLILTTDPFENREELASRERAVRKALGEEYFFDIRNPHRKCKHIPGITEIHQAPVTDDVEFSALESFLALGSVDIYRSAMIVAATFQVAS